MAGGKRKKRAGGDLAAAEAELLAKIDFAAEFTKFGLDITGDPKPDGWCECRAMGRDDRSPSAAVNVKSGRYKDSGGDGASMSFWDFAAKWGGFGDWRKAREHYAQAHGIDLERPASDPAGGKRTQIEWQEWNEAMGAYWCSEKKGIIPRAVVEAGGQQAMYLHRYSVVAVPVREAHGKAPCGWVLWNASGSTLPVFRKGDPGPPEMVKMKTLAGSRAGWIGERGLKLLAENPDAVVWKTEGPTDLLALESVLTDEQRASVVVLTNSNGTHEQPRADLVECLRGRTVRVIHDADEPGEVGGKRWAEGIAAVAAEVRHVRLPFEVAKNHGKDLRDWLCEGHDLADLERLAEAVEPLPVPTASTAAGVAEEIDDPHRLAKLFLGATGRLRYWQDSWHRYGEGVYREVQDSEMRADLTAFIRGEFERAFVDEKSQGADIEFVRKVTIGLVSNVRQALQGRCIIPDATESQTWLDGSRPVGKFGCLVLQNGILDLDSLFAGGDEKDTFLPHSEEFFGHNRLGYPFRLDADCPKWLQFLERNLEGDEPRIRRMQEWFGYCLTRDTGFQRFLVLEGEGANGKSVVCAALIAMLGQGNCSSVPLEMFGERFPLIATLNKLANVAAEIGEIDKAAEGVLKSFVAGDQMMFERKYREPIMARPMAKLIFATNNRPKFSDKSSGLWRRMDVFPMRVTIPSQDRIRGMDKAEYWVESGELPGMLLWAIRGLERLREAGDFTPSTVCSAALDDYRNSGNPSRVFVQDHVRFVPSARKKVSEVYAAFAAWCRESGIKPPDAGVLGREIGRLLPAVRRTRGTGHPSTYVGLHLYDLGDEADCGE